MTEQTESVLDGMLPVIAFLRGVAKTNEAANGIIEYIEKDLPSISTTGEARIRAAANRLCEAIAQQSAANGLHQSGLVGWKEVMDAEEEFDAALKACRTALDGRPR